MKLHEIHKLSNTPAALYPSLSDSIGAANGPFLLASGYLPTAFLYMEMAWSLAAAMLASPGSSLAALIRFATPGQQQSQVKRFSLPANFASFDCAEVCSPYSVYSFGSVLRHSAHPGHAPGIIQERARGPFDQDGVSAHGYTDT